MDLNRPFGDGRDNNGDGVVDDPLEAGEPFLDINGNGRMDYDPNTGKELEPYLDLNGDHKYNGPGERDASGNLVRFTMACGRTCGP